MQLARRITSQMHSPETISDVVLPPKKKTTSLRASTTLLYLQHLHYLSLLTLSRATTSPSLLSHQTCQNTNPPQPATSRTQIVNTIRAEAVAKQPVITTLAPTKIMMIGNSSSAIRGTPSSRTPHHQPTLRQNLRATHLHQSTQRSFRGTHLLQLNKSA